MDEEGNRLTATGDESSQHQSTKRVGSSKWEALNFKPDIETGKKMYKESIGLIPPPPKTQSRNRCYLKKSLEELKKKIKTIFRKVMWENEQRLRQFKINPTAQNQRHLSETQCNSFVVQYEKTVLKKFHQLTHNLYDLEQDFLYRLMQKLLKETEEWVEQLRNILQAKYQSAITRKLKLKQQLSSPSYNMSKTPNLLTKGSHMSKSAIYGSNNCDMGQLEYQFSKLLVSEVNPEEDIQRAYQKVEKGSVKKDSRHDDD